MTLAWAVPVFHISDSAAMEKASRRCDETPGFTITDHLLRAASMALQRHPAVNAHFQDDEVLRFDATNIGLAVANPQGLVVPVVHGVEGLSDAALSLRRRDVVTRARGGGLRPADVADGTFTVSNLGMFDVERFDAILNIPQVAILAVGAARDVAVFHSGRATLERRMNLTLTCDHRALDGATAADFLGDLVRAVEGTLA